MASKSCSAAAAIPTVYDDVIAALENRGVMPQRPPGLEATQRGLKRIAFSCNPEQVVVVAGTNGKGSVCATLEALLLSAGETVGLFTSPHIVKTTERIRINGQQIDEDAFCHAYAHVCGVTPELSLTHFETLTLMAAYLFQQAQLSWMIFEVGLGGTWDATNAILHNNCVITSISKDHTHILGNTLPSIAQNKFGIVTRSDRPDRPLVVHAALQPELREILEQTQREKGGIWKEAYPFSGHTNSSADGPTTTLDTPWGAAELSLVGKRAIENTTLALTMFASLGFEPAAHLASLATITWPCRMTRISYTGACCPVYVSGDHNPSGVESLLQLLPHYTYQHIHLLVGIGKHKASDEMLSLFASISRSSLHLTCTPFDGCAIDEYGDWIDHAASVESDPWRAFVSVCKRASPTDMVLVTGSLYLTGLIVKNTQTMSNPYTSD